MTAAPRTLHCIRLSLTVKAPWLVHGNDPGSFGLDAVQLRGPHGQRILPGTLVAGRIRDSWQELGLLLGSQAVPAPSAWFGPEADADSKEDGPTAANGSGKRLRQPARCRLHVDDLIETSSTLAAPAVGRGTGLATRVPIDPDGGAAQDGMLLAIEQGDLPGDKLTFTGTWHAWLAAGEGKNLARQLARGLRWHSQLGAERSIGFGELADVHVSIQPGQVAPTAAAEAAIDGFVAGCASAARGLRLTFTQPLAVTNQRINGNLFKSGEAIPGAALLGALANVLRQLGLADAHGQLPPWFEALRITHALPCAGLARPAPLPLSLVAGTAGDGTSQVWDIAGSPKPELLDGNNRAVRFAHDWKVADSALAKKNQGWGAIRRHLRVRTAMSAGQAKSHSLFAYDCVLAANNPDPATATPASARSDTAAEGALPNPLRPTHWRAVIDLLPGHNSDQVWRQVAQYLQGAPFGPIGKTDAFASVTLEPATPTVWPARLDRDQVLRGAEVVLLLVTPALLFPTEAVCGHTSAGLCETTIASGVKGPRTVDLDAIYSSAFGEIARATPLPASPIGQGLTTGLVTAGDALTLLRHYSRQSMVGGDYLFKRFRRGPPHRPYLPQVLTEAGSVFVFRVENADMARSLLQHWQGHGLPLGKSVVDAYTDHWQHNPWLPQNGYGEVLVNPSTGFANACELGSTSNSPQ